MGNRPTKTKQNQVLTVIMIVLLAAALLAGLAFALLALYGGLSPKAEAAPAPTPAPTAVPTPTPEPAPVYAGGYFVCEDGLFRPEDPLTVGELSSALRLAAGADLTADDPAEILTEPRLRECLSALFGAAETADAMGSVALRGDETVTRAEAAVILNNLFDLTEPAGADFPDVEKDYWARQAALIAAVSGRAWPEDGALPQPGFLWVDGYLYCADEDGYFLKNRYLGSLYFSASGRYTSGSLELDDYVAAAIREQTEEDMTRDERLYAMYLYVRDSFTYLRRHYYHIGDVGWALSEALTMYSTGKGNCYCYSSAFWAAARGLGYDAKIVSGTYGDEHAPHGWVEIYTPDGRLTYDVEIEMVSRREGNRPQDLFAMDERQRRSHGYVELVGSDNLAPRETNEGLLPG